jgi:hypothetical protein
MRKISGGCKFRNDDDDDDYGYGGDTDDSKDNTLTSLSPCISLMAK